MTHPAYKSFVRRFKSLLDAALLNFFKQNAISHSLVKRINYHVIIYILLLPNFSQINNN